MDADLHAMAPERFEEEVHSFHFWLGAVRGYLDDEQREPGPGADLPARERDALVTVLCNYCVGETTALEGAGGLIRLAPNRSSKIFLATQTVDEGRHLEVLTGRLRGLGVSDVEGEIGLRANPFLVSFKERLLGLVEQGRWECALFAQNVILEAMEFAAFGQHASTADAVTRELLLGIIKDERRHMGFGENRLGRALAERPELRPELQRIRQELDYLVLGSFEHVVEELGVPASRRAEVGRSYLGAVERLGFA